MSDQKSNATRRPRRARRRPALLVGLGGLLLGALMNASCGELVGDRSPTLLPAIGGVADAHPGAGEGAGASTGTGGTGGAGGESDAGGESGAGGESAIVDECGTSFAVAEVVTELSSDEDEISAGESVSGDVLLIRGDCGAPKRLIFMEKTAKGRRSYDLTTDPDLSSVLQDADNPIVRLLPDGKSLLFARSDKRAFLVGERRGADIRSLTEGPFASIRAFVEAGGDGALGSPVMSGDELVLTFAISDSTPRTRHFQARRSTRDAAFDAPTPLTGDIEGFWHISALSFDARTAFVLKDWNTYVFQRERVGDSFRRSPATPIAAMITSGSCASLLGQAGPGGCLRDHQVVRVVPDPRSRCRNSQAADCLPQCGSSFELGGEVVALESDDLSETREVMGVSDAGAVLYATLSANCVDTATYLAKPTATGYASVRLTPPPDAPAVLATDMALSADGELLVYTKDDRTGFLSGKLQPDGTVQPLQAEPFDWLSHTLPLACCPALSGDSLTFTFTVVGSGIFQARRANVDVAFPSAVRLEGEIAGFERISGLSYDGRTAFVIREGRTYVFERALVTDDFHDSGAPALDLSSVRVDKQCGALLGTRARGVCGAGDIVHVSPR